MQTTSLTKFTYRIEPNPAGGFIARPSDASMETIEGATREEVQEKIRAKLTEMIESQLPSELKLGPLNIKINRKVNITTRSASAPNAGVSQNSGESLLVQNSLGSTSTSSDTISNVLRIAAGVLAVLAIIYFLLRR